MFQWFYVLFSCSMFYIIVCSMVLRRVDVSFLWSVALCFMFYGSMSNGSFDILFLKSASVDEV